MFDIGLIQELLKLIENGGMLALLLIIVVGLIIWIEKRTVPRMAYEKQAENLEEVRTEMYQLIGPALDRLTSLQEKQLELHEEMWHRLEAHSDALNELSRDIKLISHELTMQRLESPSNNKRPH